MLTAKVSHTFFICWVCARKRCRHFFFFFSFASVPFRVKSFWSQCKNFKMDKHKRRFICIHSISRWHKAKQTGLNTLRSTFFFFSVFDSIHFSFLCGWIFLSSLTHCQCVPNMYTKWRKTNILCKCQTLFFPCSLHPIPSCDHYRYKLKRIHAHKIWGAIHCD